MMEQDKDISVELDDTGKGTLTIYEKGEKFGEMVISVKDKDLTVYHTEVEPKAEGRGFAKRMFDALIDYTRKNELKLIPLCSFVQAQLKRNEKAYEDVWKK